MTFAGAAYPCELLWKGFIVLPHMIECRAHARGHGDLPLRAGDDRHQRLDVQDALEQLLACVQCVVDGTLQRGTHNRPTADQSSRRCAAAWQAVRQYAHHGPLQQPHVAQTEVRRARCTGRGSRTPRSNPGPA